MADNSSSSFDAGAYWQQRVTADADVAVVGHRAMGRAYNSEIYARRIEALEAMLERHIDKAPAGLRVLDIGCGSGFYTGFWQARGVREYVGLDISGGAIGCLARAYPEYQFVEADITERLPGALLEQPAFDVITAFDVLYHIIDDQRAISAFANIADLLAKDGKIFVMDLLCRRDYQLCKHVIYRARDEYLEHLLKNRLVLADSELLFHFLVPPICGIRPIDFFLSGTFNLVGCVLRLNDRLAVFVASRLRRLDSRMRKRGIKLRNSELLVFETSNGARD